MRTVHLELVQLYHYRFCGPSALEKGIADNLHQVGLSRVQQQSETFRIQLSGFAIGLIQHLPFLHAKRSGNASLGELFQFVVGGAREVDASVRREKSTDTLQMPRERNTMLVHRILTVFNRLVKE